MAAILVVDDEPLSRQLVGAALSAVGHQVRFATNGRDALAQASQHPPDLVVTDVIMPEMDGWAFVRSLRSVKTTSLVPVIFLTAQDSSENRMRGFNLGADDLISKKCVVAEICSRVQIALERSQQMRKQAAAALARQSGFMGDLGIIGLASLLSMFEMERRTGELILQHDDEEMRIALRAGRIIAAATKRSPELPGEECIYRALAWSSGQFFLATGAIDGEDTIGMSTAQLLLEGARRADEHGAS